MRDVLVPDYGLSNLTACNWCHGTSVRRVRGDGSIVYLDGEGRTNSRSTGGNAVVDSNIFGMGKSMTIYQKLFLLLWNGVEEWSEKQCIVPV